MANTNLNSMTALIIPLSSSSAGPKPQPPGGKPPGEIDNTLPGGIERPEHPIYYPLPPGAPVDPSYGIPEGGGRPDQGLPGSQPKPDQGLPGQQPKPGQGLPPGQGGQPSHPIVLPPDAGGGWLPVYIWGQGPRPDQGLPGQQPKPDQGLPPIETPDVDLPGDAEWVVGWTPATGWVSVAIVVPENPIPTPSKQAPKK